MVRIARWRIILAVLVSLALGGILGNVNARSADRWSRYHNSNGDTLTVKSVCLQAEDSAAHLRLRSFSDGSVTYGCFRRGY